MTQIHEGDLSAGGMRFAIIVSRYNEFITERLLKAAVDALLEKGASDKDIAIYRVPGSFEIPQAARWIAAEKSFHGIICLGALIRGKTMHFQIISEECARGIQQIAADFQIPVTFGVITAETSEQAVERAGDKSENKGWEAALAAIEMANLKRKLKKNL